MASTDQPTHSTGAPHRSTRQKVVWSATGPVLLSLLHRSIHSTQKKQHEKKTSGWVLGTLRCVLSKECSTRGSCGACGAAPSFGASNTPRGVEQCGAVWSVAPPALPCCSPRSGYRYSDPPPSRPKEGHPLARGHSSGFGAGPLLPRLQRYLLAGGRLACADLLHLVYWIFTRLALAWSPRPTLRAIPANTRSEGSRGTGRGMVAVNILSGSHIYA